MSSKDKASREFHTEVLPKRSSHSKESISSKISKTKFSSFERKIHREIKTDNYSRNNVKEKQNNVYTIKNRIPISSLSSINNSQISQNQYQNVKIYESFGTKSSTISSNIKTIPSNINNNFRKFTNVSPSVGNKSKYIIEKKKVEYIGRKKYNSASKNYNNNSNNNTNNTIISNWKLRQLMKNLWIKDNKCSNVESLVCLNKYNIKNKYNYKIENINEVYEEEIKRLKSIIIQKEKTMNKLLSNLKQLEKKYNIQSKQYNEIGIKNYKSFDNFDQDAHELQIISTKPVWNQIIIPSPVNEIFIESIKFESYEKITKMRIREEDMKLTKIPVLEIQEMGALSIFSKKRKRFNYICQHLESLIILSRTKLMSHSEFNKEEKIVSSSILDMVTEEKPPLVFQKIEDIKITPIINKPLNKIQELDGLQIINCKTDTMKYIKRRPNYKPQTLSKIEIPKEYDMLLVKPVWDNLKIQGCGLNLLAVPPEPQLENQALDDFYIPAAKLPEKIEVLFPLPELFVQKLAELQIITKKVEQKKIKEFKNIQFENVESMKMSKEYSAKKDFNIIQPDNVENLKMSKAYSTKEPKSEFINLEIEKERIFLFGIPKKEEKKINWNELAMPTKTTKLLLKSEYNKKDWNLEMIPTKTTKLLIPRTEPEMKEDVYDIEKINQIDIIYNKKKEEYDIENFNLNLSISSLSKKLQQSLKIEKEGFGFDGFHQDKNEIILQKINIKPIHIKGIIKKKILIPSKNYKFDIISNKNWNKTNRAVRVRDLNILEMKNKPIMKQIKEVKLFIKNAFSEEKIKWNDVNSLRRENSMKILHKKKKEQNINWNLVNSAKKETSVKIINKPKPVQPIVKIEKVNWNKTNKMLKNKTFNLLPVIKNVTFKLEKMKSFNIIRKPKKEPKIVIKDWNTILRGQRNTKFNIPATTKAIKLKMVKSDKFMIQREKEEEIIFNDDYNYLKKKKSSEDQEKNQTKEILIKEKETIPRMKREIKAQISRVKVIESEDSSQSEIDVLAGIKSKIISAAIQNNQLIMKPDKITSYEQKIQKGEVIFNLKSDFVTKADKSQKQSIEKSVSLIPTSSGGGVMKSNCNISFEQYKTIKKSKSNKYMNKVPNDSKSKGKEIKAESKIHNKTNNNEKNINCMSKQVILNNYRIDNVGENRVQQFLKGKVIFTKNNGTELIMNNNKSFSKKEIYTNEYSKKHRTIFEEEKSNQI